MLHQVSHSNSKTTINADRRGNKGSRIVIEAIDKKLALLFVKQDGSSVSAELLNGVAFFFAGKGRVAAVVQDFMFLHLDFPGESSNLFYADKINCKTFPSRPFCSKYVQLI